MILLIDNYDSFTYNLYQLAGEIQPDIRVVRNDEVTIAEIEAMQPSHLILSPGPGRPAEAGICEELIRRMAGQMPILGICLGHQAICESLGAEVTYAKTLIHGKKSTVHIANGMPLFRGLPPMIEAGRYHSLPQYMVNCPENRKIFDGWFFCQIPQTLDKSMLFQYHDCASMALTKRTVPPVMLYRPHILEDIIFSNQPTLQWHSVPRSNGILHPAPMASKLGRK